MSVEAEKHVEREKSKNLEEDVEKKAVSGERKKDRTTEKQRRSGSPKSIAFILGV